MTTVFVNTKNSGNFDGSGVASPLKTTTLVENDSAAMVDDQAAFPLVAVFVLFFLVNASGCNPH